MRKTLFIVGAGVEQIPAYKEARKRGLIVVGSDQNPAAPALKWADYKILASSRDAIETVRAAIRFVEAQHPIDGVMTIANDVPYTVASVASALGLNGISLESARRVSDKLLMKQAFQSAGVPCPWFAPIFSASELKELISEATSVDRYIIKPVDGRGARGVILIDQSTDVEWAFAEAKRWGETGRIIVEKFISGMQLSTESFLIDGVAYTPAISERNYEYLERFSPYIIENGGTIPAPISDSLQSKINELISSGAAALGVRDGVVKGDLVINSDGEPMIIELALRLSGGWFATHQIPAATGVNLVEIVIAHALGEKVRPEQLTPIFHRAAATRYWFPSAGKIIHIDGEAELVELPGLIAYDFFRKAGELQPEIRMHPDRFGYLIVEADDRESALTRVDDGLSRIHIEISS